MPTHNPTAAWSFEAIGTQWWVGMYENVADKELSRLKRLVAERIETFDRSYSRFRPDSLVSRMATTAGTYKLPEDSSRLFAMYRQLYELTEGGVTPLIGQALSDAGYDAEYSLKPGNVVMPPKWDDVMSVETGKIRIMQPILLDFGAAGKGYLVDIIAELLREQGIERFCVDAGGDMLCQNIEGGIRVGLENPDDSEQAIGLITLNDGALCGSAGNRRTWDDYTHILDPRTLSSSTDISAIWCRAADTLTADGLTTALYFTSAARLKQAFEFEYCIVNANGTMDCSEAFRSAMFTKTQGAIV